MTPTIRRVLGAAAIVAALVVAGCGPQRHDHGLPEPGSTVGRPEARDTTNGTQPDSADPDSAEPDSAGSGSAQPDRSQPDSGGLSGAPRQASTVPDTLRSGDIDAAPRPPTPPAGTDSPGAQTPDAPPPSHNTGPAQQMTVPVHRVIDGDTFTIISNGVEQRVRLIGVDTPETVKPGAPVDCYGPEASRHVKTLLEGRTVTLEIDPLGDTVDRYGRWLRHARLDNTLVAETIIASGWGYEYTYAGRPYTHQDRYRAAQHAAQTNNAGLWAVC